MLIEPFPNNFFNIFIFLISLCFILASGCSHKSIEDQLDKKQNQSRPRSAAYGADHFYNDPNYKEDKKKIPTNNIFFKKCEINEFAPFPIQNRWECTEAIK